MSQDSTSTTARCASTTRKSHGVVAAHALLALRRGHVSYSAARRTCMPRSARSVANLVVAARDLRGGRHSAQDRAPPAAASTAPRATACTHLVALEVQLLRAVRVHDHHPDRAAARAVARHGVRHRSLHKLLGAATHGQRVSKQARTPA
eukprot:scaffold1819_cov311-Prasinococcus_capsulatus_cf.AAC.3